MRYFNPRLLQKCAKDPLDNPGTRKYLNSIVENTNAASDSLAMGPVTSTLISALIGGGLGYGAHKLGYSMTGHPGKDILGGAAIGAGSGMLANIVGALVGEAARKKNVDEAEWDVDEHIMNGNSNWATYLVPGVAGYRNGYWGY